ncbi:MAG: LysR substrate-binding domain-containing protein [Pigmentiphaga sp.]
MMSTTHPDAAHKALRAQIKLRHLQALVAIAQGQTLMQGAEILARTPSALSKSLAELEELLGQRLFARTSQGMQPTPVAENLIAQTQRGLGLLFDALGQAATRQLSDTTEVVRVGTLPTGAYLTASAIKVFRQQCSEYDIRVLERRNSELLSMLRARDIDFIIGRLGQPDQMTGMTFEPLYEECTICVVSPAHPLREMERLALKDVCKYPLLLPESGTVLRTTLDPLLFGQLGGSATQIVEMMSAASARPLMDQSNFVWFTAPGLVELDLQRGWLTKLEVELPSTRRYVGITTLIDEPPPVSAGLLMEVIRRQVLQPDVPVF